MQIMQKAKLKILFKICGLRFAKSRGTVQGHANFEQHIRSKLLS